MRNTRLRLGQDENYSFKMGHLIRERKTTPAFKGRSKLGASLCIIAVILKEVIKAVVLPVWMSEDGASWGTKHQFWKLFFGKHKSIFERFVNIFEE